MTAKENKGLARARDLYGNRSQRAEELKAEGKKVMGYFCLYPVLELFTAFDIVPFRILGDMDEPITKADSCLPTIVCPFIRSSLDLALKGRYDFFDGVVMCHSCEVGEKAAHIWRIYTDPAFFHFLDTPHTVHDNAVELFKSQIGDFQKSLEGFTGKKVTNEQIKAAVDICNEQRLLVKELYDLNKSDPPIISGAEMIQVMVALMSIPVSEGIELLKEVLSEVKERTDGPQKKPHRVVLWGTVIDNTALIEMIENVGANVVMDDTCVGSRAYFPMVEVTDDPLEGIARRYLIEIKCPRTFHEASYGETKKDYMEDLEYRFGYIKDYAKEWNADGVILQSVRYCDIHGYDTPGLQDYLTHVGLPNIYIEHDYSEGALAPLRTRVQGFLELIG
ncbi:MAG: 2-hydroxyacyl-CoA dehydratase family protein [Syntrophales bacterium]|nr:2-hydroxyacyl-CoA dehydratase family protein [Syntrophales bacterium]